MKVSNYTILPFYLLKQKFSLSPLNIMSIVSSIFSDAISFVSLKYFIQVKQEYDLNSLQKKNSSFLTHPSLSSRQIFYIILILSFIDPRIFHQHTNFLLFKSNTIS